MLNYDTEVRLRLASKSRTILHIAKFSKIISKLIYLMSMVDQKCTDWTKQHKQDTLVCQFLPTTDTVSSKTFYMLLPFILLVLGDGII